MNAQDHRLHTGDISVPGSARAWPPSWGALVRMWPWVASLVAAAVADLIIGALRHFDFAGIEGFSTTNWGWIAFSLVGGIGLAWRLAKPPGRWWLMVRPLAAPILAFVVCFVAVTVMGLLFLPGQPLTETVTTDAQGRSIWVAIVVAVGSCLCEAIRLVERRVRRLRAVRGPDTA